MGRPPPPTLPLHGLQLPGRRRLLGAAAAAGAGGLLGAGCASTAPGGPARDAVVPFSTSDRIGALPEGWRLHVTRPDRPITGYGLERVDDRVALHARSQGSTSGEPLPCAMLCCVWDGQAAPETVLPCARSCRIRHLVVDSGSAGAGQWHAYRRNVVADFQRVFGEPPGHLTGVGVLTDSDDLKGRAEAWYGDLVIE